MSNKRFQQLAELGCIACIKLGFFGTPPEIHHCKGHGFSSMGKKAKDEDTIPLCYEHHRGSYGYHKSPETFEDQYGTQEELLELTNKLIRGT